MTHGSSLTRILCVSQMAISAMIRSGSQNRQAFICLLEDINYFDFEDRKKIQELVCELMSTDNGNNELVMLVRERGNIILDLLLSTYENPAVKRCNLGSDSSSRVREP